MVAGIGPMPGSRRATLRKNKIVSHPGYTAIKPAPRRRADAGYHY